MQVEQVWVVTNENRVGVIISAAEKQFLESVAQALSIDLTFFKAWLVKGQSVFGSDALIVADRVYPVSNSSPRIVDFTETFILGATEEEGGVP